MDPVDDLRRTARIVAVPGTPLSLRLDGGERRGGDLRLAWSYVDPTGEVDRLRGETVVDAADGAPSAWAAAQLQAAHHLKLHLDLDTLPGRPPEARTYGLDEAWGLLLTHLGRSGEVVKRDGVLAVMVVEAGGRRVRSTLRTDREGWAAYVNQFADDDPDVVEEGALWVPTAVAEVDGLPLWAADELDEMLGSCTHAAVVGHEMECVEPPESC